MSQPPTSCGERRKTYTHHPIPGNMWTEGLSTADLPQKKKKEEEEEEEEEEKKKKKKKKKKQYPYCDIWVYQQNYT